MEDVERDWLRGVIFSTDKIMIQHFSRRFIYKIWNLKEQYYSYFNYMVWLCTQLLKKHGNFCFKISSLRYNVWVVWKFLKLIYQVPTHVSTLNWSQSVTFPNCQHCTTAKGFRAILPRELFSYMSDLFAAGNSQKSQNMVFPHY